VREFAMTAISNGLACTSPSFRTTPPSGLSDYARNAARAREVHATTPTHDSIGLGETVRPTSRSSTASRYILGNDVYARERSNRRAGRGRSSANGPSCWVFSRQNLPHQPRTAQVADIERGGYVLKDWSAHRRSSSSPLARSRPLRWPPGALGDCPVVSMPSTDVRSPTRPARRGAAEGVSRVNAMKLVSLVGAAVGLDGAVIGIDSYGASAPIEQRCRRISASP
jgi:transketolase